MIKQFYFKKFNLLCVFTIQMSNSSIQPIDRTLSGATTLGQNEPGSNGSEGVLTFPKAPALLELLHQIV